MIAVSDADRGDSGSARSTEATANDAPRPTIHFAHSEHEPAVRRAPRVFLVCPRARRGHRDGGGHTAARPRAQDSQGTLLVVYWRPDIHGRVALVNVATGAQRVIADISKAYFAVRSIAVWSPNGRLIAVVGDRDGCIRLFSSDGRRLRHRPLGSEVSHFAWAPNSRAMVMTEGDGHRLVIRGINRGSRVLRRTGRMSAMNTMTWCPNSHYDILRQGRSKPPPPTSTSSMQDGSAAHSDPDKQRTRHGCTDTTIWSPDGRRFATGTEQEDQADPGFAFVDADSGALTEMPALGSAIGWSPDGTEFAFFADRILSLERRRGGPRVHVAAQTSLRPHGPQRGSSPSLAEAAPRRTSNAST